MSNHNGLPGFDAWLTTQPTGTDEVDPTLNQLAKAKTLLLAEGKGIPEWDEVYSLACMLAEKEDRDSEDEAKEHAAESSREDSEDRFGEGPL